jgi:hypothetical protein
MWEEGGRGRRGGGEEERRRGGEEERRRERRSRREERRGREEKNSKIFVREKTFQSLGGLPFPFFESFKNFENQVRARKKKELSATQIFFSDFIHDKGTCWRKNKNWFFPQSSLSLSFSPLLPPSSLPSLPASCLPSPPPSSPSFLPSLPSLPSRPN